jgi:predicted ester cyclase
MSKDDNKALANRVHEAINRKNLKDFEAVVSSDLVDHMGPRGTPGNRDSTIQLIKMLWAAFPDLQYKVEFTVAEGDMIVQRLTGSGTMKGEFMGMHATGKHATWTETHITRIANGKAVEHWASVDQLGMLQQLGLIPVPEQAR